LFNFERELSQREQPVATQAVKQTREQQQRDAYETHRHRVFSLAFYMTGNEIEAEDILASTFVRAFQESESPDAFRVDTALLAELNEKFALRQEEATAVAVPGAALHHRNVRRPDMEVAVRNLPANERLIFLLHDVEGYPAATIARLLDIPETGIRRIAFSARIRLHQWLAEQARIEAA
jgi:RNA polymerase sigma-70 factor, ECF subfamily